MNICFIGKTSKKNGPEKWRQELSTALSHKHQIVSSILSADVIHTYNQSIVSVLIGIIFHFTSKKIIHTVHGDFYEEANNKTGLKKIFWIPFNKIQLYCANKITFPSKYLFKKILSQNQFIKSKSVVIPNGITLKNTNFVPKKHTKFTILDVTNFNLYHKARGIMVLAKAFNKFNKLHPQSVLNIIGGGKYFNYFKNKCESKTIHFLGFQSNVEDHMKNASIFFHVSFLDSFSIVALESMNLGIPTIVSNNGGMPEVVGCSEAIVSPNANSIFNKLNSLYVDRKKLEIIKIKQAKIIKDFDINKIANLFEKNVYFN